MPNRREQQAVADRKVYRIGEAKRGKRPLQKKRENDHLSITSNAQIIAISRKADVSVTRGYIEASEKTENKAGILKWRTSIPEVRTAS